MDEAVVPGWHSMTLQNIGYASTTVASLFLPLLEKWLSAQLEACGGNAREQAASHRLANVVGILLKHGDKDLCGRLNLMASTQLANGANGPTAHIWLPVLIRFQTATGIASLENAFAALPVEACGAAVALFGSIFHDARGDLRIDLSDPSLTPDLLLRLTRLGYQHVRTADDAVHDGVYSPDARDHAERARNAVLNALLNTKGMSGWHAKSLMVDDPLFADFRDRVTELSRERSAEESDDGAFDESDVIALDGDGELPPANRDQMFALLVDRLDDLDDLLLRDDSPRGAWALIGDEMVMRNRSRAK